MSAIHVQPSVQGMQPTLQHIVQGNKQQSEHMTLDDDHDEVQQQDDKGEDAGEIQFSEVTLEDMLYGYLPGENYNPMEIERDGHYPEDFKFNWTYEDIIPNHADVTYPNCNGSRLCLKTPMHRMFNTLLSACGTAWCFSYNLLKCITFNSIVYV